MPPYWVLLSVEKSFTSQNFRLAGQTKKWYEAMNKACPFVARVCPTTVSRFL